MSQSYGTIYSSVLSSVKWERFELDDSNSQAQISIYYIQTYITKWELFRWVSKYSSSHSSTEVWDTNNTLNKVTYKRHKFMQS